MAATTITATEAEAEASMVSVLDAPGAAALLGPERLRLVEALREQPDSTSGLARRLGESRQRLNYHLRALEEAGVLRLAEERRRGNFTERVLRVAARGYVVDPGRSAGWAPTRVASPTGSPQRT
jgi:DNA-binding transcriptional ArsR family regulator